MKRKVSFLICAVLAAMLLLGSMTGALAAVKISIGNDRSASTVLNFPKGALENAAAFTLNGIEFRVVADKDSVCVTYGDLATAAILKSLEGKLEDAGVSLDDLYIKDGCIGLKNASSEKAAALVKVLDAAGIAGQWMTGGDTMTFRIDSNSLYLNRKKVAKTRFVLKAYDAEGDKISSVSIRIKKLFDHGNIPDTVDVKPSETPTLNPEGSISPA